VLAVETLAAGDIAAVVDLPERQLDHFFSQAYSKPHKCFYLLFVLLDRAALKKRQ